MSIFYICDQKKECKRSKGCIIHGGECQHTTDINHALFFKKDEYENYYENWPLSDSQKKQGLL